MTKPSEWKELVKLANEYQVFLFEAARNYQEESIPLFYEEMERVRTSMGEEFEYIFINDGSSDKTLDVLRELNFLNPCAHYLSFSRNFGKEAALYAGLQHASGDYVTVMDVDLQDPPELLIEMKQKLEERADRWFPITGYSSRSNTV